MSAETDLAWMFDGIFQVWGASLTYSRGSDSVVVDAVPGNKLFRTSDGKGNVKTERAQGDFVVRRTDLVLNSAVVKPARGDRYQVTLGGITDIYEVMPLDTNEPAYQDLGRHNTLTRLHGKHAGTV